MQAGLEQSSMKLLRATAMVLLAMSAMYSSACKKKSPKVPAASTTPTITAPEPKPAEPTVQPPTTTTSPETAPSTAPETTTVPPPAPKPKPKHRVTHKPKTQVPPAAPTTQQQSAKNGATGSGEAMSISPDLPKDEVASQKRATEQMLQNAESNLRGLNRQLSDGEQNMARQVRNYITQSRLATQDGDLERAHNLAVKAQLLSGELTK